MAEALNRAVLETAGINLRLRFDQAKADRVVLEQQWLRNIRQYRGVYDPDVENLIPKERSKVYPRDTYVKCTGFIAKMMEMMFPATDTNFSIIRLPYPSIEQTDLQNIINGLRAQKHIAAMAQMQQAQQQGQQAPPPNPEDLEPTSDEIETAVDAFADARADNMMKECQSQLDEIDYPDLAKRALRSGGIYGWGVTVGPEAKLEKVREWVPDKKGMYKAVSKTVPRPVYYHEMIWNLFPDLAAKTWDAQEYMYQRIVMSRHELSALAERADFIGANILEYLAENRDGNYKTLTYENDLNILKQITNINKRDARRYEIIRYYGFVSGHDLRDIGLEIKDDQMATDVLVDFWLLDSVPIKAQLAPFGKKPSDMFHAYIHADDEDSGLTGLGIPQILRDSQMSRCAVRRMLMDNAAAVAGPIFGLDESKMAPGKENQTIHSFSTLYFDGDGDANFRIDEAMKQFNTDAHIEELLAFEDHLKQDIDTESNLPSWTLGNAQPLGEAFRTSQNMSQMTGGANVVLKDNVRAFDRYTKSLIGSLLCWNMDDDLNNKKEIKGDFDVQPRGTISLVAKEVRGAALDQLATTLTPQDRLYINNRKFLVERLKSRDLPPDLVKSQDECDQIDQQQAQAAQMQSQVEQKLTQSKAANLDAKTQTEGVNAQTMQEQNQAKIADILSNIQTRIDASKNAQDKLQLEHVQTLLEDLRDRAAGVQPQEGGANNNGKGTAAPSGTGTENNGAE